MRFFFLRFMRKYGWSVKTAFYWKAILPSTYLFLNLLLLKPLPDVLPPKQILTHHIAIRH